MDIGLILTGAAVAAAFIHGRDTGLRKVLLLSWAITAAVAIMDPGKSVMVLTMTLLDLAIGCAALARVTEDTRQARPGVAVCPDARIIGGLSMALMPAHFVMSASGGAVNWTIYAVACNLVFVLQCLIAGGWLDGVGRVISRIVDRMPALPLLRRGWR